MVTFGGSITLVEDIRYSKVMFTSTVEKMQSNIYKVFVRAGNNYSSTSKSKESSDSIFALGNGA